MKKRFLIKLGPKTQFTVHAPTFKKNISTIAKITNNLNIALIYLCTIAFLTLNQFAMALEGSLINVLYIFVIISLALLLIQAVIVKRPILSDIPFDIYLLFFTSIISISLFIDTITSHGSNNIWGGSNMRGFSGVTIITLWFLFYIINIVINTKALSKKFIHLLFLSPIFSLFIWLITFAEISDIQKALFPMLFVPNLVLLLTQKKHSTIYFINLLISYVFIFISKDIIALFITLLSSILIFFICIIKNRKSLVIEFKKLDNFPKNIKGYTAYVNKNKVSLLLIFTSIATLILMFLIKDSLNEKLFENITLGVKSIEFKETIRILFGNGLFGISASSTLKFINSFGFIPLIIFVAAILHIFITSKKAYKKTKSESIRGLILSCLIFILIILSYFLLSPLNLEHLVILLTILISVLAIICKHILSGEKEVNEYELRKCKRIKNKKVFTFIQILLIILIICLTIYLLSSLKFINMFINK